MKKALLTVLTYIICGAALGTTCEDDLYIGYYLENPINNPEDPLPGALFLNLPSADGPFSGDLFFTYVGCQSQNIGTISGNKQSNSLTGTWTGSVDGTAQSGTVSGIRSATGVYTGSYTVDGGKQFIDVPDCIQYYIAAFGDWVLVPSNESSPDDSLIEFVGNQIEWSPASGAVVAQCQVLDMVKANCGEANAVVWQGVAPVGQQLLAVPIALLADGADYIGACGQFDSQLMPLAFSKTAFTYSTTTPANEIVFSDGFESF